MSDTIQVTPRGLYCPAGDVYIDPWRPVPRAIVTHAHADHATPGCDHYLTAARGVEILGIRVNAPDRVEGLGYGERRRVGDVTISLHPAGHIVGSAQVCVDDGRQRWVVSGDYKTDADATCDDFEPVPCDVFITEATFGLPVFRWPEAERERAAINAWWRGNQDAGRTSIIGAYALGKAQRVLHALDPEIGPILVHGAVDRFTEAMMRAGVPQPTTTYASPEAAKAHKGQAMVVAPPSALAGPWVRKFGAVSRGFASGWMHVRGTRRREGVDRGFVLSDHADWDGLLRAIEATGASRVGVTHGTTGPLVRYLREERGLDAFSVPTRYEVPAEEAEA